MVLPLDIDHSANKGRETEISEQPTSMTNERPMTRMVATRAIKIMLSHWHPPQRRDVIASFILAAAIIAVDLDRSSLSFFHLVLNEHLGFPFLCPLALRCSVGLVLSLPLMYDIVHASIVPSQSNSASTESLKI